MAGSEKDKWARDLAGALQELLGRPSVPVLDIEWLLSRCADTRQYQGQLRDESVRQLVKDVRAFEVEFPGLLPQGLLDGPGS
ncbi:hypothetical protein D7V77_11155 [Corallococcus sp. CA041A]|nr:hypothetical protein D7V77_11155 [Corallococcus sp. CA041A]